MGYEIQSEDSESVTVTAKGREVEVQFPLTVKSDEQHTYCESANGLEVWYYHKDEYEAYTHHIVNKTAMSLQEPVHTAKSHAVHIVSHHMIQEE